MRVGFYGARWLGWQALQYIAERADVVGVDFTSDGWWGTVGVERREDVFATKPELVVSVLTDHIFTTSELAICPVVNLHPAPLPQYRGCNSYSHAIINDDDQYAVSLHRVEPGIDTGPVIADCTFRIPDGCTARELYDIAQPVALSLLIASWAALASGDYDAIEQDHSKATYYPRKSLEPYRVLKHWPPHMRERIRRGLTFPPFPPPSEG